ncbi:MAG TPA: hypothetical protein ENK25_10740 [Bacteroidetes bacterium]|nr:hypothetical protein [Bacteroidota bacterium]
MIKKIIFFSLILSTGHLALAQNEIIHVLDDIRVRQEPFNSYSEFLTYSDIKGSPYLFSDYRDADIYMKNDFHYRGKIRYDMYTDEMEYQIKNKTFWLAPKESIVKIILDDKTFLYLTKKKNSNEGGFYELLTDGPCQLLAKHLVNFREAEKPKPYQDPKPARFEPKKDLFYLKKDDQPLFLIQNKKKLIDYLQDKRSEIATFIKKNHISVSRKKDLKKLVEYYNGLSK